MDLPIIGTEYEHSYFQNNYFYEWSDTGDINEFIRTLNAVGDDDARTIEFNIPKLNIYGSSFRGMIKIGEMNTLTRITRKTIKVPTPIDFSSSDGAGTEITVAEITNGASIISNRNDRIAYANAGKLYLRKINTGSYDQKSGYPDSFTDYYTTFSQIAHTASPELIDTNDGETITLTGTTVTLIGKSLPSADSERGVRYQYTVQVMVKPDNSNAFVLKHTAHHSGQKYMTFFLWVILSGYSYKGRVETATSYGDPLLLTITNYFEVGDISSTATGGVFTRKGVPYNAYQLFRKAMLTTDAYLIDNDAKGLDEQYINDPASIKYPIKVSDEWAQRMSSERIFETVFEQKNLWEILLQIGYYLHAIPFLTFARDGTDAFLLTFRQLGKSQDDTRKEAGNTKLTVFNSLALDEYFANYDSYVTNLFSPQNICEEYLVVHTSDHSNLVSNDTAELHTAYAITEIVQFLIKIEINGVWREFDATNHLFEQSIYDVLSVANPYQVVPCKGTAIYYTLGGNKIQGFQFTPPSPDGTVYPLALQRIIEILTSGVSGAPSPFDIKYNDLRFFVKYRTQDYARLSQFRPDLDKFIKNNEIERYPHHAQFYGQQDKIIDSERFTANLHGKLVKVANALYQSQEYCENSGYEKESGDLIQIDGDPYYVTKVENEYYPDAIFQKVTYSKDFNQMSNIVTIPSEPRFYEVSERSKLRREIQIFDFFKLSGSPNPEAQPPTFLPSTEWYFMFVSMLLITPQHPMWSTFGNIRPNYAYIKFLADKKRMHGGYPLQSLFPSSELDGVGTESVTPKEAKDHTDVIVPVLHFPLRNGIVFEWDMEDNFKAGDFIDTAQAGGEDNKAYQAQQPMRYCDIFGRADLCQFRLFKKKDWTPSQLKKIINSGYIPPTNSVFDTQVYTKGNMSLAIDKDNREALSFNYQINLLFDNEFVTFPNLFGDKKGNLKFVCMDVEQNQFNKNVDLSGGNIISNPMPTQVSITTTGNEMSFNFGFVEEGVNYPVVFKNKDDGTPYTVDDVQSIVMYVEVTDDSGVATGEKSAYLVRNVGKVPAEDRLKPWYIYPVFNE